jgi:hypothetical protein
VLRNTNQLRRCWRQTISITSPAATGLAPSRRGNNKVGHSVKSGPKSSGSGRAPQITSRKKPAGPARRLEAYQKDEPRWQR